ncbi:MAG: glycine oxidase ThiO [Acidobacteriota bacterium]|nr:glycine oxidase ThiO [Acidobacteriota bacterium]
MPSAIVIGAGVVGATIARELSSAGVQVRLLDARTPGGGATRASAGILAPYVEGHASSPLRELGRQSLDLYDEFIIRLRRDSHRDIVYERSGTLEVALTQEEAERLSAASATLWREGVEARWVPPAVLPDLEPNLSPHATGGLLIPMHGFVGVASLTSAAVAVAEERGAHVMVETGALGVRSTAGGGVEVRAAAGTWEADFCVMAAGSWSSAVDVEGADAVPVTPVRGQLLQLGADRGLLGRVTWGAAGYLVPWPDGSILVGGTVEDVGFDESTTQEGRRGLIDMAVALVPALTNAGINDFRAGLRPRGPDDLPIVGRSKAVPGLIYATGHYRNGVLLAPLTADLVRKLIVDPAAATIPALDPLRCGNL